MPEKQSTWPRIVKVLFIGVGIALTVVIAPFLFIFVSAFFMFDGNCGEDSEPVTLMRSLSKDELAALNTRIMALSEEHPFSKLTNHREPYIPDDLNYLDARYISFRYSDPYVVLAKCNVSVGVTLYFEPSKNGHNTIGLEWENYGPTRPYRSSEILWTDA